MMFAWLPIAACPPLPMLSLLCCHAVKLLGWGEDEAGRPYWLALNSWSPQWGEGGFFRFARGINECEIESMPAAGLADV